MSREQDLDYQPRPQVIEHPAPNPHGGFDLRVKITDAKTGNLIRHQPHRIHTNGQIRYFEFPKGSGNLWFENNEPAGRVEYDAKGIKSILPDADHIEYIPEAKNVALEERLEAAEQELAALRAEKEASMKKEAFAQKK